MKTPPINANFFLFKKKWYFVSIIKRRCEWRNQRFLALQSYGVDEIK